MKVKSLKIATVEGRFVKIGQEFELPDKVAKQYIEAGFVEALEVQKPKVAGEDIEPETTKTKAK